MKTFLTVKVLGVISAVVGPLPDWNTCTGYLPDFEKTADHAFNTPAEAADMQKKWPGIKRTDITYECKEYETKPELGLVAPKPVSGQ